ncbi:MAG: hypothetical protein Q8P81_03480 [Nanoarchaeota archaeon]|nr:hypothetical protein [Nanoarchaeota archaeon]
MNEVGRLVLFSSTFGATQEVGIIIESDQVHTVIYWIADKKKEYLANHLMNVFFAEGIMCYAS